MRAYRKVDDGYQFRIEGGRLALLGVGAGLVLLLVFLLGVLVGRHQGQGATPGALPRSGAVVAAPKDAEPVPEPEPEAAPAPAPPLGAADLRFYKELKEPEGSPLPPEPAVAPRSAPPAPPVPAAPAVPGGPSPVPVREPAPPPVVPASSPVFTVQVGSFHDRAAAEELAQRVGAPGLQVQVVASVVSGRTWYRVQAGRFDTRAAAEAHYRDRLRARGVEGFVTTR